MERNIVSMKCGSDHICALTGNGKVLSWGRNLHGQLGLGHKNDMNTPQLVPGLFGVKAIGCGDAFSCAVLEDGSVLSWGSNSHGELGLGHQIDQDVPQRIPELCNVKNVVCGGSHVFAVLDEGDVYCWGRNQCGQLGIGERDKEVYYYDVPYLNTSLDGEIVEFYCGENFSFGRTENGLIFAWGDNSEGQLGVGNNDNVVFPYRFPTNNVKSVACGSKHAVIRLGDGSCLFSGRARGLMGKTNDFFIKLKLQNISNVSCGRNHTFLITEDGTAFSLGRNNAGQLGIGNTEDRDSPQEIEIGKVKQIYTGGNFAFALGHDFSLSYWGENNYGQLGTANENSQAIPEESPLHFSSFYQDFKIFEKNHFHHSLPLCKSLYEQSEMYKGKNLKLSFFIEIESRKSSEYFHRFMLQIRFPELLDKLSLFKKRPKRELYMLKEYVYLNDIHLDIEDTVRLIESLKFLVDIAQRFQKIEFELLLRRKMAKIITENQDIDMLINIPTIPEDFSSNYLDDYFEVQSFSDYSLRMRYKKPGFNFSYDRKFDVNKSVLMLYSKFFEELLESDMGKSTYRIEFMSDPEALQVLLKFFHFDSLPAELSRKDCYGILKLLDFFDIKESTIEKINELIKFCERDSISFLADEEDIDEIVRLILKNNLTNPRFLYMVNADHPREGVMKRLIRTTVTWAQKHGYCYAIKEEITENHFRIIAAVVYIPPGQALKAPTGKFLKEAGKTLMKLGIPAVKRMKGVVDALETFNEENCPSNGWKIIYYEIHEEYQNVDFMWNEVIKDVFEKADRAYQPVFYFITDPDRQDKLFLESQGFQETCHALIKDAVDIWGYVRNPEFSQ